MRLTKLEINGFKSFARKTELYIDPGVTAVIGPNGSGKSNIADAVRWVLGEQSAKALRGSRMEDVIFNGTEERKPQAYCEVALTFDNSDGALPVDFLEVMVQRRVYRSGESEYMINRNTCRLKDIHELFRDTGIGKEGYSIIGQGKVEEILSNKSGDRRAAFEEAAGVMRYRVRKEEAERKLEHTRKNLVRLEDILSELSMQITPLQQQSEDAERFLKLRDELKDLELNVFLAQYDRNTQRIAGYASTISQLAEEETVLGATERELAAACAQKENELYELDRSVNALQNELLTLMSGAEAHVGEYNVLRERMENLNRDQIRLTRAMEEEQARERELTAALFSMANSEGAGRELLTALDGRISAAQSELLELEQKTTAQETLLEQQKNSIMESMNRLSDAKSNLSRLDAMAAAFNQRLLAIANTNAEYETAAMDLSREKEEAVAQLEALNIKKEALSKEKSALAGRQAKAAARSNEAQARLQQLQQRLDTEISRRNVLEEMSKAHEGYYSSVRNILRDSKKNSGLTGCVLGVVAELIGVPKQYETALEMSLGSSLQNIVTPTPEDAKVVIGHLRKCQYGRATLLPVSAMRSRLLNKQERACLSMPGCIGVASELVTFDERYRGVVENLLGRTVVVETLDAGIALNKRANAAFRIATVQGDIIHPGGSMTGGSVQKREFSLLGREREIRELQDRLENTKLAIAEARQISEGMQQEIDAAGAEIAQLGDAIHANELIITRHMEKIDMIDRDVDKNKEDQRRCALEREQIEDNLKDIAEDRANIERLQSGIEEGSAASQEDVQKSQEALTLLRQAHEEKYAALSDDRVQRMALQKEEDAAKNEAERLTRECDRAKRSFVQNKESLEKCRMEQRSLLEKQAVMEQSIGVDQRDVQARKDQQHALEEERAVVSAALSEMRARKDDIGTSIRELSDRKHRQELNKNKAEMELAAMQDRVWEEYELTYDNILPLRRPVQLTSAHLRIDELKAAIRELGSINVNAIEDYKSVFSRHEDLSAQCADLNQAEQDLQSLIQELTESMEREFLTQFQRIQENFGEVFRELFGGGYAELRLSDKNDVLNCEIDIIAQPPGKKLQLLSLLSGGERALTAIALLFAVLKLKPTAFCVLDEIESSLDEVNVARFANYVKAYSENTQFIIITHRKGSMEVCNALYGVAMEEKGVSKVVSARFHDHVQDNAS